MLDSSIKRISVDNDKVQENTWFEHVKWEIHDWWRRTKIYDCYRYLANRFIHRYHLVLVGTPGQWSDSDTKLENAIERILIDFVEGEKPFEINVWETESEITVESKIKDAYNFFKVEKPATLKKIEGLWSAANFVYDSPKSVFPKPTNPVMIKQAESLEEELEKRQTAIIIEIIKIRKYLWT